MAASKATVEHVCNVLEEVLGITLALDLSRRLVKIDGNQSYKVTVREIERELKRRKER